MKKYLTTILLITFSFLSAYANNPIEGNWDTKNYGTIVSIKKVDGVLKGIIKSSGNKNAKEGMQIIRNLKATDDGYEGEIYSVKRDKWMDAEFTRNGDVLEVEVSVGFISKTVEWDRK